MNDKKVEDLINAEAARQDSAIEFRVKTMYQMMY